MFILNTEQITNTKNIKVAIIIRESCFYRKRHSNEWRRRIGKEDCLLREKIGQLVKEMRQVQLWGDEEG